MLKRVETNLVRHPMKCLALDLFRPRGQLHRIPRIRDHLSILSLALRQFYNLALRTPRRDLRILLMTEVSSFLSCVLCGDCGGEAFSGEFCAAATKSQNFSTKSFFDRGDFIF